MLITHFYNNSVYFIATLLTPTSLPDVYNMPLPPQTRLLVQTWVKFKGEISVLCKTKLLFCCPVHEF